MLRSASPSVIAVIVALPLGVAVACGNSSDNPPPLGDRDGGGSDVNVTPVDGNAGDSVADTAMLDGNKPVDAQPVSDVVPTGDGPLGGLQVVDEPNPPCVPAGGSTTPLYLASVGTTPPLSELVAVASRRAAAGPDVGGLVTFDVNGANASTPPTPVGDLETVIASEGSTIAAAGANATKVLYQRFDATGAAQGPPIALDTGLAAVPQGLAIGAAADNALVVWGSDKYLYAAGVNGGAPAGTRFVVAAPAFNSSVYATVAPAGANWIIAWTADPATGLTSSSIAFANATGLIGQPTTFTVSSFPFKVRKIVPVGSGFMLLVDGASPTTDDVFVIPLDATGKVSGAAHRLVGSDSAWDIAVQGSTLGVVATRSLPPGDAAPGPTTKLFRPLSTTGAALGPWVCVGGDEAVGQRIDMAIDADGTGFAVVSRAPNDDEVLTRFSATGQ